MQAPTQTSIHRIRVRVHLHEWPAWMDGQLDGQLQLLLVTQLPVRGWMLLAQSSEFHQPVQHETCLQFSIITFKTMKSLNHGPNQDSKTSLK